MPELRTSLHPKKLRATKWTARQPVDKEKHFVVVAVVEPADPTAAVEFVELEAVYSGRRFRLPWRDLKDERRWRQGWHG